MAKEEYEYKMGKHFGHAATYLSGKHRKAKGEALKKAVGHMGDCKLCKEGKEHSKHKM